MTEEVPKCKCPEFCDLHASLVWRQMRRTLHEAKKVIDILHDCSGSVDPKVGKDVMAMIDAAISPPNTNNLRMRAVPHGNSVWWETYEVDDAGNEIVKGRTHD